MKTITIPKQRLRAIKYYSPLFIYVFFYFTLSLLARTKSVPEYFGVIKSDVAFFHLALFTYGAPLLMFLLCIYIFNLGLNVYKFRQNPPPNIPVFKDTIAKTPKCPVCFFIICIIILVFSIYLVYFGHGVYGEILNKKST